jgi:subtilisin
MARFVISGNRFGPSGEESMDLVDSTFRRLFGSMAALTTRQPAQTRRGRLLFECESEDVAAKQSQLPDGVSLEREIIHQTAFPPLEVIVRHSNGPIPDAIVRVMATDSRNEIREFEAITNTQGVAQISVASDFIPISVIVDPLSDCWSSVGWTVVSSPVVIACETLPGGPIAWWHEAVGVRDYDLSRGAGIRVGVIDTGIADHECLPHVKSIGSYLGGELKDYYLANPRHGTHVSGLIGARPLHADQFCGVAPGVELFFAAVFNAQEKANQLDIANAIDVLASVHSVDLINLSLGSKIPSDILRDAIADALTQGTLSVCAAGNEGGDLMFPAAWPETISVAAIGRAGWGAADSVARHYSRVEPHRLSELGFFSPKFSSWGNPQMVVAPGVGIISTVPSVRGKGRYGEMSGTSMASPIACGTIAASLSLCPEFRTENAAWRVARSYKCLDKCQTAGLDPSLQGKGIPFLD